MVKRILLFLIVVASLGWLTFVVYDILSDKSNYDETTLFGTEDGTLFIVNRGDEVKNSTNLGLQNSVLNPIVDLVLKTDFKTAYISEKRNHILIKKKSNWDKSAIKKLLNGLGEAITFESNHFHGALFSGRFYKKSLYINDGKLYTQLEVPASLFVDKKASASKVEFNRNNTIKAVTDLYFLPGNKTNYITHNKGIRQGNQIKDQEIFAHVISKKIKNYHFIERDYYASQDSIFSTSPMFNWVDNGFLEVVVNGKKALISDYIAGQDPVLILNDLNQTLDTNQFNNPLTANFPTKGNSHFIKYIDDLVVMSEDENTCNTLIADFKLGNTASLNTNFSNLIYANLPKAVSERYIGENTQYSKTVYQGKILETQLGTTQLIERTIEKETKTYNCEFDIQDFATFHESKSVVVLGKNGVLKSFENGKEVWQKALTDNVLGSIQTIDLHNDNNYYTLLNTSTNIYLWDESGVPVSGFPIAIDSELTNEVKFYRWKGKSYFIAANAEKQIMHFDSKGRELNIFSTDILVSKKIDVWVSNRILFAGLANEKHFRMVNLDNYKKHRKFDLPNNTMSAKIPNELLQFGFDGSTLFKIDQKGTRHNFMRFNRGKLKRIIANDKNPILVVQDGNEIILLNTKGIPFASFKVPFNEIDHISVFQTASNKTLVGIIDGLENNVYFYTTDGNRITQKSIEGQTKVTVSPMNNENIITTVMDQFIVQYFLN